MAVGGTHLDTLPSDKVITNGVPNCQQDNEIIDELCKIYADQVENYIAHFSEFVLTRDPKEFPWLASLSLVSEGIGMSYIFSGLSESDLILILGSCPYILLPAVFYLHGLNQKS